ncbi:MAG: heavy metal transporter [Arthrobacter sp.]|nr:heavy metal transporter [Arthrobacter sp.]
MNPVPFPGEPAGPDSPAAPVPPGPSAVRPPSLDGALGAPAPGRTRVTRAQADEGGEAVSAENYYATALRRAQMRLSASVAAAFLTVVSVLAIAAASWDLLESTRLAGLPLSWWLIGVALYPLVLGAALLYQAAARRLERRYQRVSGEGS